jgi:hypothetical protein
MIARGDLAVEIGYRRLAEMQEEILWLCEAASVPVIWATQVLDEFVKTGIPTRAKITDAAMAERADCVMLNKGLHVVRAVEVLDDLLPLMEAHQTKKTRACARCIPGCRFDLAPYDRIWYRYRCISKPRDSLRIILRASLAAASSPSSRRIPAA